ncbi:hypothetical protein NI18_21210 [Sphingomonas sp. Ant20]|nr:hypothetical protein NI18_21210 [Sphingomonas sp. Ant20]
MVRFTYTPSGPGFTPGRNADVRLDALLLRLLEIELREIDRLEQQRREAAVTHRIRQHAAGEREEQARGLAQQEGLDMLGRDVAQPEQARKGQVDDEGDLAVGLGADVDLQHDLVHLVADLRRADVELDVDRGRGLVLVDCGRVGVLEREILDVLRDQAGGGRFVGTIGKRLIRDRHAVLVVHDLRILRINEVGPKRTGRAFVS